MEEMLKGDETFCLLVVCIRNLKRLDQRYSPAVIENGVKALLQRFEAIVGGAAIVGRWDDETFAAILQIDPAAVVISLSRGRPPAALGHVSCSGRRDGAIH